MYTWVGYPYPTGVLYSVHQSRTLQCLRARHTKVWCHKKNRHPFSEAALEVISWSQPSHTVWICSKNAYTIKYKLVKKEIKCSEDFKILNEIFRETTRKLEKHELIRVVSRSISCSISKFPAHLIFFKLCIHVRVYCFRHGFALEFAAEQYLSKQKLVCSMRYNNFNFYAFCTEYLKNIYFLDLTQQITISKVVFFHPWMKSDTEFVTAHFDCWLLVKIK